MTRTIAEIACRQVRALRFRMVKVRVKVPFNLDFGRVAQIGDVIEVRADDARWLTSERCGAWAEKV